MVSEVPVNGQLAPLLLEMWQIGHAITEEDGQETQLATQPNHESEKGIRNWKYDITVKGTLYINLLTLLRLCFLILQLVWTNQRIHLQIKLMPSWSSYTLIVSLAERKPLTLESLGCNTSNSNHNITHCIQTFTSFLAIL